ncbi:MAG: hypothetical protein DMG78_31300 [Acidobacteria bacterium]|nr:MAG: hypothetical protein DMG78_31300 [Acidobacteriota bacterium]
MVHKPGSGHPWIDRYRKDKNQPTAYEHFQWLTNLWKTQ